MVLTDEQAKRYYKIHDPVMKWAISRGAVGDVKTNRGLYEYWTRPGFLDEYLNKNRKSLSDEARSTLAAWRDHAVQGPFIIERFTDSGAAFFCLRTGLIYLVSGILDKIEELPGLKQLPALVDTVLFPFEGRIVYEGTLAMAESPIPLWTKAGLLAKLYESDKAAGRLIGTLPAENSPGIRENWEDLFDEQDDGEELKSKDEILARTLGEEFISEEDRKELDAMLEKPHRTEDDWTRIKKILASGALLTFWPAEETSRVSSTEGILDYEGILHAFTSFDKQEAFIRMLAQEKALKSTTVHLTAVLFEEALQTSMRHKKQFFINYESSGKGHFIAFNPRTKRITAMKTVSQL